VAVVNDPRIIKRDRNLDKIGLGEGLCGVLGHRDLGLTVVTVVKEKSGLVTMMASAMGHAMGHAIEQNRFGHDHNMRA
jgi:hypothetical protein